MPSVGVSSLKDPSSGMTKVPPPFKQMVQLHFVMMAPVFGLGVVKLRRTE